MAANTPTTIKIKVFGEASGKLIKECVWDPNLYTDLLSLFTASKIPIASSCGGEGQCLKCQVELQTSHKKSKIISCLTDFENVIASCAKNHQDEYACTVLVSYL